MGFALLGEMVRIHCHPVNLTNIHCLLPDNHMINGTKLLNVAGMSRGRRDGILKT